jgi:hypothetical protein
MCTVPAVMQLYSKAITRLHQQRRGAPAAQTKPTEEKILGRLLIICLSSWYFGKCITLHFFTLLLDVYSKWVEKEVGQINDTVVWSCAMCA